MMEGLTSAFNKFTKEAENVRNHTNRYVEISSPFQTPTLPASSAVIISRPPRHLISLWTCSKVGAVCFIAGVFVGYTLKRRVRRWVSSLLRRLKDE